MRWSRVSRYIITVREKILTPKTYTVIHVRASELESNDLLICHWVSSLHREFTVTRASQNGFDTHGNAAPQAKPLKQNGCQLPTHINH